MKLLERVFTSRWCFWLVLGCGAVLRIAWAVYFDPNPVNDGKWYWARSTELADGLGYQVNGLPTAYWPVGYPALLGLVFKLFGTDLFVMRLLQALLGTLCLFAIHEVAHRASASLIAARAAMLLIAVYPGDIAYTSVMLSEPSYNAWMMSGMAVGLSTVAWRLRIVGAGLLFALAALTKPQGILLPVMFGLLAAGRPRSLKLVAVNTGVCVLVMCAALSPWWVRNALVFDAFVPVSNNGGINLFVGNNPRAQGGYRSSEKVERGGRPEYDSSEQLGARARAYIYSHWERTVRLWPRKLTKLLEADVAPFSWSRSIAEDKRAAMEPIARLNDVYYRGLWLAALAGWLAAWRPKRIQLALLCTIAALLLFWWITDTWLSGVLVAGVAWLADKGGRPREMPLRALCTWQLLTVLAVTVVYFGDFRYHHAMMPWAAIFAAHLFATAATSPLAEWIFSAKRKELAEVREREARLVAQPPPASLR
jgi:hypothetical protein